MQLFLFVDGSVTGFCKHFQHKKLLLVLCHALEGSDNTKAFTLQLVCFIFVRWHTLAYQWHQMWYTVCDEQDVLSINFLSHILFRLPQPSVLIVSYIESAKAAAQFGFYQKAEWKPDDSMIAVAVSTPHYHLILYLKWLQLASPKKSTAVYLSYSLCHYCVADKSKVQMMRLIYQQPDLFW